MKTSKRILGIALAVIMIFNVFAVGAFAMPDNAVVDLIIKTDKTTYAPGDTITITIATQVIPELGMMQIGGQYDLAFPSTAVEPSSTEFGPKLLEAHGFTPLVNGFDTGNSGIISPSEASGIEGVAGADTTLRLNVADTGSADAFDAATAAVDLFTFTMKVKADAEPGTYTIGFNKIGYDECSGYSNDGLDFGGLYGNDPESVEGYGFDKECMYNCGTVTFTVATPASKIIFHEDAMYNEDGTTEETAMLGFIGYFNKDDIGGFEFIAEDSHTLANVTAVGATIEIVGLDSITRTSQTIHPTATDGVYNFRAILEALDLEQYGDADMKITYFITLKKGDVEETQYSDTKETTANKILDCLD